MTKMFASENGSYGRADRPLLTFKQSDLTKDQWDNVAALGDYYRYDYIVACIDNDLEAQNLIMVEY